MAQSTHFVRTLHLYTPRPNYPPVKPPEPIVVKLTETESKICTNLDEFCKKRAQERPEEEQVVCRIAGGWVRDKLLGIECNDIDIALSTMTGQAFAQALVDDGRIANAGTTIASNPEQSKHLETTKVKMEGLEVDLVNLRSEKYTADSRIPIMEFGTPLGDAERRDLTINALFYNIHSNEVEDLTGKGLDDLRNGVVRTPLEPKTTFDDDPLRVLRCVRFASRLGYAVEESVALAGRDEQIHHVLATKISRERVAEELDKMIKGRDPLYSIQLLHDLNLLGSVFILSPQAQLSLSGPIGPWSLSLAGVASIDVLLRPSPGPAVHPSLLKLALEDKSTRARLTLASALSPFRGLVYQQKKGAALAVESVLKDGLKLGTQNHYADGIPQLYLASDLLKPAITDQDVLSSRLKLGLLLRQKSVHNPITGSHWSTSLLFTLVQEMADCWTETGEYQDELAAALFEKYTAFANRVEEYKLQDAVDSPPLVSGKAVCATLGISPGPAVKGILDRVIEWQLENPGLGVEECNMWLKKQADAGTFGDLQAKDGEGSKKKRKFV